MPTIDSKITTQTVQEPGVDLDAADLVGAGPSGQDIFRERVQITGAALAEVSRVINTAPVGTEYALATRNIPQSSTLGSPTGIVVSTAAVLVQASNVSRKSIVITNNASTGNVYIGKTNAVTASGVTMGVILEPNGGSYNDSGEGIYTGDIYAISDTVTAVANVSSWERT